MPYQVSKEFWAVLAARLAFVIVFQVGVCLYVCVHFLTVWGRCAASSTQLFYIFTKKL